MINKSTAEHYKWGDNCDSWIFCNSENLSIKLESMPAGASEKKHIHTVKTQFFFVLQGTAIFNLDGKQYTLRKKEGIYIPPNTTHYLSNKDKFCLEFLVITTPNLENDRIDTPGTYNHA